MQAFEAITHALQECACEVVLLLDAPEADNAATSRPASSQAAAAASMAGFGRYTTRLSYALGRE